MEAPLPGFLPQKKGQIKQKAINTCLLTTVDQKGALIGTIKGTRAGEKTLSKATGNN